MSKVPSMADGGLHRPRDVGSNPTLRLKMGPIAQLVRAADS